MTDATTSVITSWLSVPHHHKPNTFRCPIKYCNGMRNVDLDKFHHYTENEQSLRRDRATTLMAILSTRPFRLGYGDLQDKAEEVMKLSLCKGHCGSKNAREEAGRMLGEIAQKEGWMS